MYLNQYLFEIMSRLSNFSKEELVVLRDKINQTLAEKKNIVQWKSFVFMDTKESSVIPKIIETKNNSIYTHIEAKKENEYTFSSEIIFDKSILISQETPSESKETPSESKETYEVKRSVYSQAEMLYRALLSREIEELKNEIQTKFELPEIPKKSRRPSGIWKGKVNIPENFDDLSNDISDFGIDK